MRGERTSILTEEDLYDHHEIKVDPGQEPLRLDKYLKHKLYKVSRNRIQTAIKVGSITVNGLEVKSNYKVKPGDEIEVLLPRPFDEACKVIPDNIPLDIRYEDEDVLIVHKPPGMVVHPGIGNYRRTLVNALAFHYRDHDLPIMDGNPQNRMGLVHRIDKNTSGLLVVAKNEYAMNHLAKQFFHHTIHRRYQAIVWGEPEEDFGCVRKNVGRHPRFRQRMAVFEENESGKWAATHYRVLERLYYVSLVECRLETGRTHQIRVHMEYLGHPLFNDDRYGGDRIVKGTVFTNYKIFVDECFQTLPRHALHAKELGFVHPRTGKEVFFDSELPPDMQRCLQKWRDYVHERKSKLAKS